MVVVQVLDTGNGLEHWGWGEEEINEGLGLSLIKNLIGDLGGKFVLRRNKEEHGTIAEVRFPLARSHGQVSSRTGGTQ